MNITLEYNAKGAEPAKTVQNRTALVLSFDPARNGVDFNFEAHPDHDPANALAKFAAIAMAAAETLGIAREVICQEADESKGEMTSEASASIRAKAAELAEMRSKDVN